MIDYAQLPGGARIVEGLRDLERNELSAGSLLVRMARGRLRAAGVRVPQGEPLEDAELALYRLAQRVRPDDAHVYYNALRHELDSFCNALESARSRLTQ